MIGLDLQNILLGVRRGPAVFAIFYIENLTSIGIPQAVFVVNDLVCRQFQRCFPHPKIGLRHRYRLEILPVAERIMIAEHYDLPVFLIYWRFKPEKMRVFLKYRNFFRSETA